MPQPISISRGFIGLPGVRLAYEISGRGASVIFLHGGLLDRRMWDEQFWFFARRYQTVRYDMRGAGLSETTFSTEPYTHHDDLCEFLKALQIQPVSLVGFSNYATVLEFAIAHPSLVQKLVVVSPGLRGYEFRDPWVGSRFAAIVQALEQRDLAGAAEVFLTMWVDGPYRTPDQVDPLVRERVRELVTHAFPLTKLAPNLKGLEPPAIGRLSEVRAPTLVVLGDQDALDIHAIGKLIHDQVSGSQLVTIPGAGHTLVMERPTEFNRLVDQFLRG